MEALYILKLRHRQERKMSVYLRENLNPNY
jgi:hypothetical protein